MKAELNGWQHFESAFARQYDQVVVSLRHFEERLRGATVLEVGDERSIAFSLLLEWLRPRRLRSLAIDTVCGLDGESSPSLVDDEGVFDAVFVFLGSGSIERALRVNELTSALSPEGLLILLRPPAYAGPSAGWTQMRRQLAALDLAVLSESRAPLGFLVATPSVSH